MAEWAVSLSAVLDGAVSGMRRLAVALASAHGIDLDDIYEEPYNECSAVQEDASLSMCGICLEKVECSSAPPLCAQHSNFCAGCELQYVRSALLSRFRFPLRCPDPSCRTVLSPERVEASAPALSEDEVTKYRRFHGESCAREALYCSNPHCAALVDREKAVRHDVQCHRCRARTCVVCRLAQHEGECRDVYAAEAAEEFGRRMRDRLLCRCGAVLELVEGCKHVKCICGESLCFTCGSRWQRGRNLCSEGCALMESEQTLPAATPSEQASAAPGGDSVDGSLLGRALSAFAAFAAPQHSIVEDSFE